MCSYSIIATSRDKHYALHNDTFDFCIDKLHASVASINNVPCREHYTVHIITNVNTRYSVFTI